MDNLVILLCIHADAVRSHVHETNDMWFQSQNPLLTNVRKDEVGRLFKEKLSSLKGSGSDANIDCNAGFLPLKCCYEIIFTDAEKENLLYEYFLEDWNAFVAEKSSLVSGELSPFPTDEMTLQIALEFLEAMQ